MRCITGTVFAIL